jgi:hypothetical protein
MWTVRYHEIERYSQVWSNSDFFDYNIPHISTNFYEGEEWLNNGAINRCYLY